MIKSKFLADFRAFIERGSAIDMAVGIIVGGVMTSVVNSLVKDIIMPPIGLLIGGVDFSQLFVVLAGGEAGVHYPTVAAAQAAGATTMNIGLFLNSIVSFLITMFAVLVLVFLALVLLRHQKQPLISCTPFSLYFIINIGVILVIMITVFVIEPNITKIR